MTDFCCEIPREVADAGSELGSFFSFILVNLLAVAVVWSLLFVAIKSVQIVGGFAGGLQKLGIALGKNIPVPIPAPGG